MNRRSFLARGASAIAGGVLVAGCTAWSDGGGGTELPGSSPNSSISRAGLALEQENVDVPGVNVDGLAHTTQFGGSVPLLPIDVAYQWYLAGEARFVDARSQRAYEASHVAGAVLSPAPAGYETDDPTSVWPKSVRIVTYCGCPHHLSSQRAASLIDADYEAVFALDEGFGEWHAREYPMSSSNGSPVIGQRRSITGAVDPRHAGEFVRLRHEATGQREPAEIAADGSFEVTFRFVDVDADSTLTLETPAWTRTGTLEAFTSGTVR